jgi:hypothetical protein
MSIRRERLHGAWPSWPLSSDGWVARVGPSIVADAAVLLAAIVEAEPGACCLDCADAGIRENGTTCRCPAGEIA